MSEHRCVIGTWQRGKAADCATCKKLNPAKPRNKRKRES